MNTTPFIVLMKFSEELSSTVITVYHAKSCEEVCLGRHATTQPKDNEEEGQEGFPEEAAHGTESRRMSWSSVCR